MSQVDIYIAEQNSPQREIMSVLNSMIMNNDRMEAKIRYGIPFYFQKSWVCYLNLIKKGGVEICFLRANEMANENGLLNFKHRKQVAGISYFSIEEIDEAVFSPILQEALILDETVKYLSKRKK